MPTKWTDADREACLSTLPECYSIAEAVAKLSGKLGRNVKPHDLAHAFQRWGLGTPSSYLRTKINRRVSSVQPEPDIRVDWVDNEKPDTGDVASLLAAIRKGAVSFEQLCDRVGLPPTKCRKLIEKAQAAGYSVEVAHDHVAMRHPEPGDGIVDIVKPTVGERQQVGIMTDTHLGSKYCLRPQLKEFVHHCYGRGVREILHVGDVIDGKYKHGMFELTHAGIEDQTRDLFETLPQLPGLSYHGITGNHDDTFADDVGMAPGDYMSWYFKSRGRNDLHFYGRRGAYLKVRGAVVELWHPRSGGGYALSYQLQNHIRAYGVGQKPDILLAGHWHTFVYLEQRGVHALACGTFQGGGSAFSKSLGGAPSIGGTILSWELTETRTLRRFSVERSAYYEKEDLRALELA